jgi:hypothetical protein
VSAVWTWFRVEWRGRWRALVGLALLVAFATASVQATAAGARRGATAVERLLEVTEPATLAVLPNRGEFDWDVVRAMPQVEAVSGFAVSPFVVEGLGEDRDVDPTQIGGFPFVDGEIWDTIERPVVLDGRIPDPARSDEVAVTPNFVDYFDLGVGDQVTLRLYDSRQLDTRDESGGPAGPAIQATIVGVIRSGWFGDLPGDPVGTVLPSPGLYAQFPDNVVGTAGAINVNALVRLRDRSADLDQFMRDFTTLTGVDNVESFDLVAAADHVEDVASFESRALLLLSLTALLASFVLIGVAVSRFVGASSTDHETLRTIGLTPSQTRWAAAAPPTSAAALGALVGTGIAAYASRRFPIGTASDLEPSPGPSFDLVALLPPLLVVPVLIAVAAVLSLRADDRSRSATMRASGVESITSTWPLPIGLGTRFALSARTTHTSGSARPALVGAVLGVTGVVAALTFAHGIADATDDYRRFGQTYDLHAFFGADGQDYVDPEATLSRIAEDPGVDAVLDVLTDSARSDAGAVTLFTHGAAPSSDVRAVDVVVTEGRLPSSDAEIALAPLSADSEGVGVGDSITLTGTDGSTTLAVTGLAFVPAGPHNSYAEGGWVTPSAFSGLFDSFRFHFGLVATATGADPHAVLTRLAADDIYLTDGPISPPTERSELAQLRTVPMLLATFLALLGIGSVAHTLTSTARRRRHDVAMLRALGMRPRATSAIVLFQAAVIALVGLAIGVPLGLVVGRLVWRSVALDTPIEFIVPENWRMIVVVAVVVLAVAALLAAWPARRWASLQLSDELRTE